MLIIKIKSGCTFGLVAVNFHIWLINTNQCAQCITQMYVVSCILSTKKLKLHVLNDQCEKDKSLLDMCYKFFFFLEKLSINSKLFKFLIFFLFSPSLTK